MNDETYPRTYEGDALRTLDIQAPFAAVIQRVRVASGSTMIVDLPNATIAVDVQAPAHPGRAWTIRIEQTLLPTGKASVIAEAHPIESVRPSLPDGALIDTAVELAALAKFREEHNTKVRESVIALLQWIAPGAVLSPLFAKAILAGQATVSYERAATGVVVSLRIGIDGPWGPTPSDLFR